MLMFIKARQSGSILAVEFAEEAMLKITYGTKKK